MDKNLEILKRMILEADEETVTVDSETTQVKEKPKNTAFEKDPMGFILKKYNTLNEIMIELMTKDFREFVDGIFYIAPKPTTFKIQLHNGQNFFLTYMKDDIYEAIIGGKRYYLAGIGEKERCMMAISRLLRFGTPLKTKGAEGAEEGTRDNTGMEGDWAEQGGATGGAPTGGEEEITASAEETGGEELTENIKILTRLLMEADTKQSIEAEQVLADLINIAPKIKTEKAMQKKLSDKSKESTFLLNYFETYKKSLEKNSPNITADKLYFRAIDNNRKYLTSVSDPVTMGTDKLATTEKWKSYGGLAKTSSKTDIATSTKNYSVKNASTNVRVLDASVPQIKALINSTISELNYDEKIKNTIDSSLKKLTSLANSEYMTMSRLYKGEKYGLGDLRKEVNKKLQEVISSFDNNTQELNKALDKLFASAQSDPSFNTIFLTESLSGKQMFGKNSSAGVAEAILSYTDDFTSIKQITIATAVKKIGASYKAPKFGVKSSGTRISKTIQQFYKEPIGESINQKIYDYNRLLILEDSIINSKLLLEDSFLKKATDFIGSKVENFIKYIFEKIKTWINELTTYLSTSIDKCLSLLGISLVIDQSTVSEEIPMTYGELDNAS